MVSTSTLGTPAKLIHLALLLVLSYPTSSHSLPVPDLSNDLVAHEILSTTGGSSGGGNTTVFVARDAEQAAVYAELASKVRAEMQKEGEKEGVGGIIKRADRQPPLGPYGGQGPSGSSSAGAGGSGSTNRIILPPPTPPGAGGYPVPGAYPALGGYPAPGGLSTPGGYPAPGGLPAPGAYPAAAAYPPPGGGHGGAAAPDNLPPIASIVGPDGNTIIPSRVYPPVAGVPAAAPGSSHGHNIYGGAPNPNAAPYVPRTAEQLLQHGDQMTDAQDHRRDFPPFPFQQSPYSHYGQLVTYGWETYLDPLGYLGNPFNAHTGLFPVAQGLQSLSISTTITNRHIHRHEQTRNFQLMDGPPIAASNLKYHTMYDVLNGVIYSVCNTTPQEIRSFDWQGTPPLLQWSDVTELQWHQLGGTMQGLQYVILVKCDDAEVKEALRASISHPILGNESRVPFPLPGGNSPKHWGRGTLRATPGFRRLMGTAPGERIALLLAQHKRHDAQARKVTDIFAFRDDQTPAGSFQSITLVFKIGLSTGTGGKRGPRKPPTSNDGDDSSAKKASGSAASDHPGSGQLQPS
ncbi:hypothetical protein LTR78_000200 [Recurvomyces mirabilis]|uniref:Uncharacterized protein n=1 Tax=Recurvomyces mirabilis TaxID=574656 RepID=A0AAE0WXL3_9PEZI|nr:hypothetical protein LTR78_000200 [Recurvomyces mirabilis]KAK5161857.1 hypothetical protein LTS14_000202 [Recurvomyces mirabilis]